MLRILFENLEKESTNKLIEELNKINCDIVYTLIKNVDDIVKIKYIPIDDACFIEKNNILVTLVKKLSNISLGLKIIKDKNHKCYDKNCQKIIENLIENTNNINNKYKSKLKENIIKDEDYKYANEILDYLQDFKILSNVVE